MNRALTSHTHQRLMISVLIACVWLPTANAQQAPACTWQATPITVDGFPSEWQQDSLLHLSYDPQFKMGYALRNDGVNLYVLIHARVNVNQLHKMLIRASFTGDPMEEVALDSEGMPQGILQAVQFAPDGSAWYEGVFPLELVRPADSLATTPTYLVVGVQALPNEASLAARLGFDQPGGTSQPTSWFGTAMAHIPVLLAAEPAPSHAWR